MEEPPPPAAVNESLTAAASASAERPGKKSRIRMLLEADEETLLTAADAGIEAWGRLCGAYETNTELF